LLRLVCAGGCAWGHNRRIAVVSGPLLFRNGAQVNPLCMFVIIPGAHHTKLHLQFVQNQYTHTHPCYCDCCC
jgi:hypothetical protein